MIDMRSAAMAPVKKKAKIVKDEVDPDIQSSSGAERVGSAVL